MIHRFKVDKLIRDKLPEIMQSEGTKAVIKVMENDEYIQRLKDKLFEESTEVSLACNDAETIAELADLLEVIMALAKANNIDFEKVELARLEKRAQKGGFDAKIYAAFVEIEERSPALAYYRSQPKKYPEL